MMKRFVNQMALLGLLVLPLSVSASEQLLSRFFAQITTLSASFNQQVMDESGYVLEISSGTFYLSRPGLFRWDYNSDDPDYEQGQQIVSDGQSLTVYTPDLDQATQSNLSDALGQVPSLLLVHTGANLHEHFNVSDLGVADGVSWVGLKPKDENASYQQLMIGFLGERLNIITFVDGIGNETRLSLSAVEENVTLDSALFEFVAPEGTDVSTK